MKPENKIFDDAIRDIASSLIQTLETKQDWQLFQRFLLKVNSRKIKTMLVLEIEAQKLVDEMFANRY